MSAACLQYVLLAVVLVRNSVATAEDYVKPSPPACTYQGKVYPLYSKWASTKDGECVEYTCSEQNRIDGIGCALFNFAEDLDKTCYEISVPHATYPYCCTTYHCEDKDPKVTSA